MRPGLGWSTSPRCRARRIPSEPGLRVGQGLEDCRGGRQLSGSLSQTWQAGCLPGRRWRFFWRLGDPPMSTQYPELNAEQVVPAAFPEWRSVMDGWGGGPSAQVFVAAGPMAAVKPVDTYVHGDSVIIHSGSCRQAAAHGDDGCGDGGARVWAGARRLHQPHAACAAQTGAHRCSCLKSFRTGACVLQLSQIRCGLMRLPAGADLDKHGRLGRVIAG
jgi:hypothetical protein